MTVPISTQILCDGCQEKKKETNHWYTLTIRQQTAEVARLTLQPDGRPNAERDGLQQYYCGRYCVLEAMNKWMDTLNGQPSSDPVVQSKSGDEMDTLNTQPSSGPVLQPERGQETEPARSSLPRTIVLRRSNWPTSSGPTAESISGDLPT